MLYYCLAGVSPLPERNQGVIGLIRKIGILTSGGDSPGMNAAVVSVARCAAAHDIQLMGIKRGYNGLLGLSENPEDDIAALDLETVLDIADQRGTFLRTARCDEFKKPEVQRQCANNLRKLGIDALVVIGGDGSFNGAMHLSELGIPCVGIPGTIDNDLGYTEATLGYDTAVNVCVDAVRSIRDQGIDFEGLTIALDTGHGASSLTSPTALRRLPQVQQQRMLLHRGTGQVLVVQLAGGFGIGLSIARSIAEGHRGAISARTEGDTITFTALLK